LTEIPIPNDIIYDIHQCAAASEKAVGIIFTDQNANIISDDEEKR